jgi:nucleotide-binding universal stress UspA family protein
MKVLLAVDESPQSRTAEAVLSTFPFSAPVELHLVSVCPVANLHGIVAVPPAIHTVVDECRDRARQIVEDAAARSAGWAASATTHLLDGHPAKEILSIADRLQPELVVVGGRHMGTVSRFMMGSVSDRVAKYAKTSVLVARGHRTRTDIHSIVVGHDGSAPSSAAVERFSSLPLGESRTVHVYNLIEEIHAYGINAVVEAQGISQREQEHAEERMREAKALLGRATTRVETHIERTEALADVLIDACVKHDADLIVLGATGKPAWERFLIGSVSLRVLHHAPCSVWLERPHS